MPAQTPSSGARLSQYGSHPTPGPPSPRITVGIPAYNVERYLRAAVGSVLRQTYADFEIVVVDDHSTDHTAAVLEELNDPRIKVYRNERNLGMTANWNRLLELARGELFIKLDADDVVHQTILEKEVGVLERHPEVGLVHTDILQIDEHGREIGGHWAGDDASPGGAEKGRDFFWRIVRGRNVVSSPTVMARLDLLRRAGGFDVELRFSPDMPMWLKPGLMADVAFIREPLLRYRRHGGQMTAAFRPGQRAREEELRAKHIAFAWGRETSRLTEQDERRFKRTLSRQWVHLASLCAWEDPDRARSYRRTDTALSSLGHLCQDELRAQTKIQLAKLGARTGG